MLVRYPIIQTPFRSHQPTIEAIERSFRFIGTIVRDVGMGIHNVGMTFRCIGNPFRCVAMFIRCIGKSFRSVGKTSTERRGGFICIVSGVGGPIICISCVLARFLRVKTSKIFFHFFVQAVGGVVDDLASFVI